METTEKIVESYCRYVKGWFTIPNIKCSGQHEIDILAIDTKSKPIKRYHIECGISISGSHSKLTGKEFSLEKLRKRIEQSPQRRTLGFYVKRKFNLKEVLSKLGEYGFKNGNYTKIIVTWGWTEEAQKKAKQAHILLWDFRRILKEIANSCQGKKTYYTDDTLRTIQLFQKSRKENKNDRKKVRSCIRKSETRCKTNS